MRKYLLTKTEKQMIQEYLTTGKKLDGFKVLVYRARLQKKEINEDLQLINQLLEKIEGQKAVMKA